MDNTGAQAAPSTLGAMSRLTVDPQELAAAAAAGERTADSSLAVAGALASTAVPDPGRPDGQSRLTRALRMAALSSRALAELTAHDAQVLRSTAERYTGAEHTAQGGAPCG